MERKGLVICQKTEIAQQLPSELEKIIGFQWFAMKISKENYFPLLHVGNVDVIPMNFDMVGNTVNSKVVKTILVKTIWH